MSQPHEHHGWLRLKVKCKQWLTRVVDGEQKRMIGNRAVLSDHDFLDMCLEEAQTSVREGGIPIGAVLVDGQTVLSRGHNRRVQDNDALAHAEIDCIRRAGRRATYDGLTLYTSGSPCFLCSGAVLQMGIPRVVTVGFERGPEMKGLLEEYGVSVTSIDHPACVSVLSMWVPHNRTLWNEDIGGFTRGRGTWET